MLFTNTPCRGALLVPHYATKAREGWLAGWQKILEFFAVIDQAKRSKTWDAITAQHLNTISFHMINAILEAFRCWGAMEANSSSFFATPLATPHGFLPNNCGASFD
jgi:hypothetical protein